MKVPFANLYSQYVSIKEEIDAEIIDVIKNSQYILSEKVEEFELNFSFWNGSKYCVGCGNGTDAIEIALQALNIGPGDEVIVPAMSWVSSAEAVIRQGAKPVFADIDSSTYCLDYRTVEELITAKTKAIMVVHLYGYPADCVLFKSLCKQEGIFLIEDCAQAHGAFLENKKVGTFGDIGIFSFYPGKNLGAYGDAGCLVTDQEELASICKQIRNHGQISKYLFNRIGRNSRLDGIQAAILNVKLKYIDSWNNHRRYLAKLYSELISAKEIVRPFVHETSDHVFHLYVIRTENRNALKSFLEDRDIQSLIHYPQILPEIPSISSHLDTQKLDYPISRMLANEALSIPLSDTLSYEAVHYVSDSINDFFNL